MDLAENKIEGEKELSANKEVSSPKKQRDIGFEFLRIFAMFLIGMVHLLNYGGFLKNAGGGLN